MMWRASAYPRAIGMVRGIASAFGRCAAWAACVAVLLTGGCSSHRLNGPTDSLVINLRFPEPAAGESHLRVPRTAANASLSIDSLRIRVYEVTFLADRESLVVGSVLADESVLIDVEQTDFEVALRVPEALQYGILVEGIGQQIRPGYFTPTEYGLQFLGFAHRTAEQLGPEPVEVSMFDVVPQPNATFERLGDEVTWLPPPSAVTDVSQQLSWTVQGDGEILGDVSTTTFLSVVRHQQYRVRINLYEGLVSAFSEPTGSTGLGSTSLSAHGRN